MLWKNKFWWIKKVLIERGVGLLLLLIFGLFDDAHQLLDEMLQRTEPDGSYEDRQKRKTRGLGVHKVVYQAGLITKDRGCIDSTVAPFAKDIGQLQSLGLHEGSDLLEVTTPSTEGSVDIVSFGRGLQQMF
ncbi:unnamed protein product [Lactuca virosa]|uniref:Uncharacterized protein n=1 Tax=Lactuca virosa TaxID=75947 RepID=A0AAU9LTV4_9ASTR|nr:unnamed protein product [Lactuca virosa]